MTILAAPGRRGIHNRRQPEELIRTNTTNYDDLSSAEMVLPTGTYDKRFSMTKNPLSNIFQSKNTKEKEKEKKKILRFHEDVRVRPHLHHNDMTDEEYFNAWYSEDEMINIKRNIKRDVKRYLLGMKQKQQQKQQQCNNNNDMLEDYIYVNDNESSSSLLFTFRGLEYRTKKGSEMRSRNKHIAMKSVLNEQEIQYAFGGGCYDDEAIRNAYLQRVSKLSAVEAYKVGIKDQLEAKLIHKEEQIDQKQQKTKNNNSNERILLLNYNHLYIQTFHRKRKVLEELGGIILKLEEKRQKNEENILLFENKEEKKKQQQQEEIYSFQNFRRRKGRRTQA